MNNDSMAIHDMWAYSVACGYNTLVKIRRQRRENVHVHNNRAVLHILRVSEHVSQDTYVSVMVHVYVHYVHDEHGHIRRTYRSRAHDSESFCN